MSRETLLFIYHEWCVFPAPFCLFQALKAITRPSQNIPASISAISAISLRILVSKLSFLSALGAGFLALLELATLAALFEAAFFFCLAGFNSKTSGCKARNLCKAVTVCLPKPESKGPGLQPRCVRNFCRARMVAAPMSPSSLPLYKGGDSLSSSFFKKFWRAMADFLPQEPSTLQSCSSSCKNCWKSSVFFPPSRTPLLKSWRAEEPFRCCHPNRHLLHRSRSLPGWGISVEQSRTSFRNRHLPKIPKGSAWLWKLVVVTLNDLRQNDVSRSYWPSLSELRAGGWLFAQAGGPSLSGLLYNHPEPLLSWD